MRGARKMAERGAREAGHVIVDVNDSFDILVNHRPDDIPVNVWGRLCAVRDSKDYCCLYY